MPAKQDIERRVRMWPLLADTLIWDYVIQWPKLDSDYARIGQTALELNYSYEEVRSIYWREVVPGIFGIWHWGDLDKPGWLEHRIRFPWKLGCLLTVLFCPWWILFAKWEWSCIKAALGAARNSAIEARKSVFDSTKGIGHGHQ